jgi:hypothetical protein
MSAAGASTRRVTIALGLGCLLALSAITFVRPSFAGDSEEPATAEVWSKASTSSPDADPDAGPSPVAAAAPSPTEYTAPATAYPLPMTITSPDSDALRVAAPEAKSSPSNMIAVPPDQVAAGTTTEEIPPASPAPPVAAPQQSQDTVDSSKTNGNGQFDIDSPDVQSYERAQEGFIDPQSQFGNPNAYTADGAFTSPIGVELCEGSRKLAGGGDVEGLMVLEVMKGSPAASAGLHAYRHSAAKALTGVAVLAAVLFPPAMLALPVAVPAIEYSHVGENYDMIIGVDGSRVTNYLDFEDRMHDVRPGEIIYLSILRDGKRSQIKVFLPPSSTTTW